MSKIDYTVISDTTPNNWNMEMGSQGSSREIVLTEDEYFLLSDNRISALDSRIFGPVNIEHITGKAVLQYFPFHSFRVLQ